MTKKEVKTASDADLVYELAWSNALWMTNYNLGRGTKKHESHCRDLVDELLKRGLLTEQHAKYLLDC